jgi:hypothetical protein
MFSPRRISPRLIRPLADTKSTKFGLSPEGFRPQGGDLMIQNFVSFVLFVVNKASLTWHIIRTKA